MRWIMKQNELLVTIGAAAGLLVASGAAESGSNDAVLKKSLCYEAVVDLIADGGSEETAFKVGEVILWDEGGFLYATYNITLEGWSLTETHLDVQYDWHDIPQADGGNAVPGHFAYRCEHEGGPTSWTYLLEGYVDGETLAIAAHAVVENMDEIVGYTSDLGDFEAALPPQVTMSVTHPDDGGPAYFPHTVITGKSAVDGDYCGWCADADDFIDEKTPYIVNVYSSYDPLVWMYGLVEYPENLDLVNWIINQDFVGQNSPCDGIYTYGDVQKAIWTLVEDTNSDQGLGSWSQCRVDEILATAWNSGEGFTPGCGDEVAVILAPVDGQQIIIAEVTFEDIGLVCEPIYREESAWGEGFDFPGADWSMWFEYLVGECTHGEAGGYDVLGGCEEE
jgi:hypothetical protein